MISHVAEMLVSEARAIFRHRLAASASLLAVSHYVAAALNLITSVVMARMLGPTGYGLVALAVAYPTLLWSFLGTKSFSVITRYVAELRAKREHEKLKAVVKLGYGLDVSLALLAFILVCGSAWWVSVHFYQEPNLAWLIVGYSASFPLFALTGASWAVLSSWERFGWLAAFEVLHPFTKLGLIITFLLAGFGVAGAVVGMGLAQVSIGFIMMAATTKLLLREGGGPWWRASLESAAPLKRELASFFGWNYLFVTLSGLVAQIPVMLLGRLRGPEEAGFYRIAISIGTVGSYFETSLGRVAYPVLSARWSAGERDSIAAAVKRWTLRVGLPAGIVLILPIPLVPLILPLLFGSDYSPLVLGAQAMMLEVAMGVVFFWLSSYYYASGRINVWTASFAVYAVLVIGSSWFVISRWGFLGLVWTVVVGKSLFRLAMLALLQDVKGGAA